MLYTFASFNNIYDVCKKYKYVLIVRLCSIIGIHEIFQTFSKTCRYLYEAIVGKESTGPCRYVYLCFTINNFPVSLIVLKN